ncbi:MAG: hypothetical protein IIA61_00590 [Candidatus Marinimicrobia bacterium]|nr:hypothetical protein [Candidatus Neomarinimicrobiota bacterium]
MDINQLAFPARWRAGDWQAYSNHNISIDDYFSVYPARTDVQSACLQLPSRTGREG